MNGYLNEHAGLAYAAQRQAELESAARRRRLIREFKSARRNGLDQPSARDPRSRSGCAADLG